MFVKALEAGNPKAKATATGAANSCDVLEEITGDHVLQLLGAVPLFARRGSAWYCSPVARALVFDAIKIAGGGNDATALASLQTDSFLGYPIRESELLPSDPAEDLSGKPMLGFGNLALAAKYGKRRDIRVALSGERWFELDQIGVRGTSRFDINVHSLGNATKKSPFVVLVGN